MDTPLDEDSGWLNQVSENLTEGKKQYVIYPEGDRRIVAAAGMMVLDEKQYYVVNRKDITEIFSERDQQVKYYQVMTLTALTVCGLLIYLISGWLMRPIVRLSAKAEDIAEGNYGSRVRVRCGSDCRGQLS